MFYCIVLLSFNKVNAIFLFLLNRMDPLLFRNVLTSASSLKSLVVKNVCSDAMLKLIGNHCPFLQHLDISNSKQVFSILIILIISLIFKYRDYFTKFMSTFFPVIGVRRWNRISFLPSTN